MNIDMKKFLIKSLVVATIPTLIVMNMTSNKEKS